MSMATDKPNSFDSLINIAGADMTERAAASAFKQAGIKPSDCQVVELHDCFSANELISYEALGLCKKGEAEAFVNSGRARLGGSGIFSCLIFFFLLFLLYLFLFSLFPSLPFIRTHCKSKWWVDQQRTPTWRHGTRAVCRALLAGVLLFVFSLIL